VDTQTWIALGATGVALAGAGLNVWNVTRSIRHNSRENDRRSLTEASDRMTGLLVLALQYVVDIDEQIDGRYDLGHFRKPEPAVRGLLRRADALRIELETARVILASRLGTPASLDLLSCMVSYNSLVVTLEATLEGWETAAENFEAMQVHAEEFHRAYAAYLGPHARIDLNRLKELGEAPAG
jgi:hypothetical protein